MNLPWPTRLNNSAKVSIHIRHCWRMNLPWPTRLNNAAQGSIHIRPCWRMNWLAHGCDHPARACFNPHSPLLANEFQRVQRANRALIVSIHIRHCWRMNYSTTEPAAPGLKGFNPHSPLLANEFGPGDVRAYLVLKFQSTFAIAGE